MMGFLIEDGELANALDAAGFNLLNVGLLDPIPPGVAASNDPSLSDARLPLDGSVVNASVALTAGIEQSKLNLNGQIPLAWLGTTSSTAAQGDLAEYQTNKGQPDGYAGLDGSGKIPSGQLPTDVGAGTVTSVGLTMPAQFSVTGNPVTGSGTLAVTWVNAADQSWFGNKSGAPGPPQFYTDPLPSSLIPDLDASIVTSGVFNPALLPAAVGLGGSHAAGVVPDPGDGTGGALATDYLARDMTYKPHPTLGPTYQPTLADPTISASTDGPTGPKTISVSHAIPGVTVFISTTSGSTGFSEMPAIGYTSLAAAATIWVYVARPGYNNSNVVNYTNPNS